MVGAQALKPSRKARFSSASAASAAARVCGLLMNAKIETLWKQRYAPRQDRFVAD
jgi:hypothetical protein